MELEHARIAKRIQQARKQAGLTQQQCADLLGVIQRTWQNYESQTSPRIPWDRLNDIARITSVKVEWLLHGDAPDLMGTLNGSYSADDSERLKRIEEKLDELLRRRAAPEAPDHLPAEDQPPDEQDELESETG